MKKSIILETKYHPNSIEQEKITEKIRSILSQKGIQFHRIDSALAFVFDASPEEIDFLNTISDVEVIRENKTRYV